MTQVDPRPEKGPGAQRMTAGEDVNVILPADPPDTEQARCRVCNRPLTSPRSIMAGVGALCAQREAALATLLAEAGWA